MKPIFDNPFSGYIYWTHPASDFIKSRAGECIYDPITNELRVVIKTFTGTTRAHIWKFELDEDDEIIVFKKLIKNKQVEYQRIGIAKKTRRKTLLLEIAPFRKGILISRYLHRKYQ